MFQRIHPLCKIIDKIYLDKPYLQIKLLLCSSETFKDRKWANIHKAFIKEMSDVISIKSVGTYLLFASCKGGVPSSFS